MNKLIIVGNGFDLAHGLNTKYSHMIDFFWENIIDKCNELGKIHSAYLPSYDDNLINITQTYRCNTDFRRLRNTQNIQDVLLHIKQYFKVKIKDKFLRLLIDRNNIQNWVDVENEYYQDLLSYLDNKTKKIGYEADVSNLNNSFELMKDLLSKHLLNEMIKPINRNNKIFNNILSNPLKEEVIYEFGDRLTVSNILILNFNYTDTIEQLYLENLRERASLVSKGVDIIHIHGDINDFETNPMIFGYGDELDEHSKTLVDLNDSSFLKNIKSINYQFTSNYKKVLSFLSANKFQTVIMGHSCGNSDRTLLNTIFEHKNCTSIKPYYHKWDGGDNYFDIVCNIYRNFTKNASFREKVVEKNLCETLT